MKEKQGCLGAEHLFWTSLLYSGYKTAAWCFALPAPSDATLSESPHITSQSCASTFAQI